MHARIATASAAAAWLALVACSNDPPAVSSQPISLQFRPITGQLPAADCGSASTDVTPDPDAPLRLADDEICYSFAPSVLSPSRVRSAEAEQYPTTRAWTVSIALTEDDGETFAAVTRRFVGNQLGIVVDGMLLSAPHVQTPITDGRLEIAGDFDAARARDVARRLRG